MELVSAFLRLESGESFKGFAPPSQNTPYFGEVVFNTGMTGYVETLTDPSYAGQILVFTYPLIGNYGVTPTTEWESAAIHVKGVVMSTLTAHHSHHNATQSLQTWLAEQRIPYLVGADTRAITTRLRKAGVIPGAIANDNTTPLSFEHFAGTHWVKEVSLKTPRTYGNGSKTIIAIDCGMKENIIRQLTALPVTVKRVPHDYDFTDELFDAVFISNGPGDPQQCQATIQIIQKAMTKQKPMFGICLGTQLMALAVGAKTYKLPFGHRAQNQPCMDMTTKRCYLTSQNHSYAVDEHTLPPEWHVTYRNLNDQSVEGIAHQHLPFFAVQFHPEAAPGPMDTQWLFQQFYEMINHAR